MIAVIGGSGFVGSKLIQELGTHNCYNIDKKQSPFFPEITRIKNICDNDLQECIDKDTKKVVLLAAEHSDDVSPKSLYYDVNVEGTKRVLEAMGQLNINQIVFTSSVAIYGLNKNSPKEEHPEDPFNHYGKSKWQAEEVLRKWQKQDPEYRTLVIVRPTVIFGERNRGNVYNLLKQIATGGFLMVGPGTNKKSMAYLGNITAFLKYCLTNHKPGYHVYNYIDKPDLSMNELIMLVQEKIGKKKRIRRIPFALGILGGYFFDLLAKISGKNQKISSVRIRKFCATTQFDATRAHESGFEAPYSLSDGLEKTIKFEFLSQAKDTITFDTE